MTSALSVSIDRSGMPGSLGPLVLHGSADGTSRRIISYTPPGKQARIKYAPDSDDVEGSEAISAVWQQAMMSFDVRMVPSVATTETLLQAGVDELEAALAQFSFTVTTQISGAPAKTWSANRGSIVLAGPRTPSDVQNLNPVYTVTIPVYPISS